MINEERNLKETWRKLKKSTWSKNIKIFKQICILYRAIIFPDIRHICWSRKFLADNNCTAIQNGLSSSLYSSCSVVKGKCNVEAIASPEPKHPCCSSRQKCKTVTCVQMFNSGKRDSLHMVGNTPRSVLTTDVSSFSWYLWEISLHYLLNRIIKTL